MTVYELSDLQKEELKIEMLKDKFVTNLKTSSYHAK